MDQIKQLLVQCPPHVTEAQAEAALKECEGNVVLALQKLWDIQDAPEHQETSWEMRRRLADEATNLFKACKSHQHISSDKD